MASNNFINECKNGAYCNRYGKLAFTGLNITEDNQLVDFKIESGCYDNGDIIGNTYVKKIEANLLDSLTDDLVDQDFEASVGASFDVEGTETTEYVDLGTYTVEKPTDTQTENRTSLIGYSQLLTNLDKPYTTQLDYENDTITIADVYDELCDNLGLTPVTTTFTNSTITVENDPFTNGEKNRDVLRSIEKVSCSFIDINPTNNKIDLKWLSNSLNYTFTLDDYSTLEGGKVTYGPINSLIIKSSAVESENVSVEDQESIEDYGEHQFVITEDYFLYDTTKRQAAITAIWNKVHNLEYMDCKLTTLTGKPFLNIGDKIRVYTSENDYFDTYILKHSFTFNGAFMSEIESPVLTQQEVQTKQDISLGEKLRNTQIVVNKQDGEITGLVSKTETLESQVEQNGVDITTVNTNLNNVNTDLQSYKQTVATQFTQTNEDFTFQFDNITTLVNQVSKTESDHYSEFHNYIRFISTNTGPVIVLGQEGSEMTAELSNDKLSFKQNGTEVAYISNNKMYITDATVTHGIQIGNFAFVPRNNGSLSFRKVS